MADQSPAVQTEQSVEDRLASFFGTQEVTETEAPAEQQEVAETPVEATEEVPDQPEDQPETAEADNLVEVEFEGKLRRVEPDIKDALMRHADYTRKTMDLSEQRRLFQKEQELSGLQAAFQKETEAETKELAQLESQIGLYKSLKWHEMDTDQVIRHKQVLDDLRDQKADLEKKLTDKRNDFTQRQTESRRQLLRQGAEYLSKTIPSWGQKAQQSAAQAALGVGFTNDEVANFIDPRAVHLAWKASQWDALQAAKPQVANKVSKAPPVTKPGSPAQTDSQLSRQYKDQRQQLKKSGDWRDAAKLLLVGKG